MKAAAAWLMALGLVSVQAQESAQTVPLSDPGTGTFYVNSRLGGAEVTVPMLVDTGASFSSIGRDTLVQLQRAGEADFIGEQRGRLADGRTITVPLYRIRRLRIGDRCEVEDVQLAVFPTADRAILGLNVLTRLSPFSIATAPPRLVLSGCGPVTGNRPSLAVAP